MPLTPPEKEKLESILEARMISIIDFLWRLENGIIDDATKHRTLQNLDCLHGDLDKHRAELNTELDINLVVDPSKQKETYPFGENGSK